MTTNKTSILSVSRPGLGLKISIQSSLQKRLRRQVLLALFRAAKTILRDLDGMDVYHSDAGMLSLSADMGRAVSLHQALGSRTEANLEGVNVRFRRLSLRLTQAEFARLAGISRCQLSRIEHGHVELEALTRAKIAFAFRRSRFRNQNAQITTRKSEVRRPGTVGNPDRRTRSDRA